MFEYFFLEIRFSQEIITKCINYWILNCHYFRSRNAIDMADTSFPIDCSTGFLHICSEFPSVHYFMVKSQPQHAPKRTQWNFAFFQILDFSGLWMDVVSDAIRAYECLELLYAVPTSNQTVFEFHHFVCRSDSGLNMCSNADSGISCFLLFS